VRVLSLMLRGVFPALGVVGAPTCKYHPSCSQYATDALRKYGPVRGSLKAAWRLLRCNPWSHGGVDYA
jgi:putative membrane protein insertion efficiency factor